MIAEVETIQGLGLSIQHVIHTDGTPFRTPSLNTGDDPENLEALTNYCERSLHMCKAIAIEIQDVLVEISGNSGPTVSGKLDALAKEYRRRGKSERLKQLRDRLAVEKNSLQVLLMGMNM